MHKLSMNEGSLNKMIKPSMAQNSYRITLLITFISGLNLFPILSQGQAHAAGYVDPYKVTIDTSTTFNFVYPTLTEREGKGLDIPVPPGEHPRLFFRKLDIPALKGKMSHPLMTECWERIVQNAAVQTDGKLTLEGMKHNMNTRVINAIEAKAFMYAFTNNLKDGKGAVEAVENYNKTLVIDANKADVCRDIGRVILTNAIVYDWCYDIISLQDKKWLIARMENLGKQLEIIWPKLVQGSIVGHGSEAQGYAGMWSGNL
jgi:hypothetical protein